MINIFVANLDFGITSDDLKATFSQFGEVTYAHVVYDKQTKKSKGFGYVEMESPKEANAAITALNGLEVEGRALDIKIATPKDKREPANEKPSPSLPPKREFNKEKRVTPKRDSASTRRVLRPRKKKNND